MDLEKRNTTVKGTTRTESTNNTIIHKSEEMRSIVDIIERIAKSNINVIITGESGTGKELMAKEIHNKSNRTSKQFVIVNCASLTEDLFDSDLFGHVRGSFTGAIADKTGYVERANGGTLYLDEITSLNPNMQAKLLRFAQNGEYNRVGDSNTTKSDVRIISSTNKKLENEIRNNSIREDLFYRLNTIVLRIPPLRKRKEDIPTLVKHFMGTTIKDVTPEAMEIFVRYPWPGNVRELINCIERIKIMLPKETGGKRNIITLDDVPADVRKMAKNADGLSSTSPQKLEDIEREHILNALQFYNGNKSKTSAALGITLKTLYNKLNKYEVEGWI
jgi:two-component system response regulator HydG